MPRKKRKLDQFLSQRKKSQELALAERARLFVRIFRVLVVGASLAFLAVIADPYNVTHAIGVALLLLTLTGLEGMCLNRLEPGVFDRPASFAKLIFLVLLTYGLYRLVAQWSPFLAPIPMFAMVVALVYSQVTALLIVLMMSFFIGLTSPRTDAVGFEPDRLAPSRRARDRRHHTIGYGGSERSRSPPWWGSSGHRAGGSRFALGSAIRPWHALRPGGARNLLIGRARVVSGGSSGAGS
jgi:hypothetical protein